MPRAKKTEPKARWMTRDELPYEALVHLDHPEEWVAWDRSTNRAVAFGNDMIAVRAEAIAAGVERPVMEWMPPIEIKPMDYFD